MVYSLLQQHSTLKVGKKNKTQLGPNYTQIFFTSNLYLFTISHFPFRSPHNNASIIFHKYETQLFPLKIPNAQTQLKHVIYTTRETLHNFHNFHNFP